MAEFGNVSEQEDTTCEMESSVQVPLNQENESNLSLSEDRSSENTGELPEEKLAKLLKEKLELDEKGEELRRITFELMKEHRKLTARTQSEEGLCIISNKETTAHAREIRNRLLLVYSTGKANETVFEKYLEFSRKCLQNSYMLNADNKMALQRKLTQLETKFSLFQEQLTTLETLMEPDYDVLCHENPECFKVVMTACNKTEDNVYEITSLILEV